MDSRITLSRHLWGYDPGAAWDNRSLWLPATAAVSYRMTFEPSRGWTHGAAVLLENHRAPVPPATGDTLLYAFDGDLLADAPCALYAMLYDSAERWSEPRLFP